MTETHEITGADPSSTGRTVIGHIAEAFPGATVRVSHVVVEQTNAADADWNVELGGDDVFSAEQSVGAPGTPERFTPDQNEYDADETSQLAVDVSTGGSAGDLNVTVVVEVDE